MVCLSFFLFFFFWVSKTRVFFFFFYPGGRKFRNEASSCPGIISRTLRFHYVASSSGSLLPHLLDGHRKLCTEDNSNRASSWKVVFESSWKSGIRMSPQQIQIICLSLFEWFSRPLDWRDLGWWWLESMCTIWRHRSGLRRRKTLTTSIFSFHQCLSHVSYILWQLTHISSK